MAVNLVLVRHGQAAAKQLGQTDAERPLTPEGLAAIRALGIPAERQQECIELYAQEEDEFLSLACASDADTIVCVGHVPFMNRMVEYLSGQPVQFDTAGVAALRVDHDVHDMCRLPARLLWFVQGPEV